MTRSTVCAMAVTVQLVTVAPQHVQIFLNNDTDPFRLPSPVRLPAIRLHRS